MGHRFVTLPFDANSLDLLAPRRVLVSLEKVSAEVNLHTGAVASRAEGRASEPPPDAAVALRDMEERVIEAATGPRTELVDAHGRAVVSFDGELESVARGTSLIVGVVSMPGRAFDTVACVPGAGSAVVRLPVEPFVFPVWTNVRPIAEGHLGAVLSGRTRALHVFRETAGRLETVTVPVPKHARGVVIDGDDLVVLASQKLLCIDTRALPFQQKPASVTLTYEPLVPPHRPASIPAVVIVVLPGSVMVEHPNFGRLRVLRDASSPSVQKGDRIILEDVREVLPGIFRVTAWSKEGAVSMRPPPMALELDAPSLVPNSPTSSEVLPIVEPSNALRDLQELTRTYGFTAPALLVRLLELRAAENVFLRWTDQLGLDAISLRRLGEELDNIDPCLLGFATELSGNELCLYLYPPRLENGREPSIVRWMHGTGEIQLVAETFEGFLSKWIDSHVEADPTRADTAKLLRERLGLPATTEPARPERTFWQRMLAEANVPITPEGSAPPWLPHVPGSEITLTSARSKIGSADLVGAERELVSLYMQGDEGQDDIRTELEVVYAALGWTYPLEHLRASAR